MKSLIRLAIGVSSTLSKPTKKRSTAQLMLDLTGIEITLCSKCKIGRLKKIDKFDGIYQKYPFHHWGKSG